MASPAACMHGSQALSRDPRLVERLIASLAPNIWEMDDIKKGVLCQLFGGVPKVRRPPRVGWQRGGAAALMVQIGGRASDLCGPG